MATDNVSQVIRRLQTDKKFLERFRSDPVHVVSDCNLTIGEVMELAGSLDALPNHDIRDLQLTLKLLRAINDQAS